jgi:hypothetical protein
MEREDGGEEFPLKTEIELAFFVPEKWSPFL